MDSQLTVRLPNDLSKKIQKQAKQMGLKRADVVRMAITQYFFEQKPESSYEKVKHLIGSVSTGIGDLAEHHQNYLRKRIKKRA